MPEQQTRPRPSDLAFAKYKRASAEYDLALFGEGNVGCNLPTGQDVKLSTTLWAALGEFFATEAEDAGALSWKLAVYRNEELFDGADTDGSYLRAIANDAHRLAYGRLP
jgi:hypothetical protein